MSSYNDLDPVQRAIADEVLRRYGLSTSPESKTQVALGGTGSAASAAASALAATRGSKVDAALASEQLKSGPQPVGVGA